MYLLHTQIRFYKVAKTRFMNTQTKPNEPETSSSRKEKQNGVTENVKVTIKEESSDLSKAEEQLFLNHGVLLYNLCS